jgi:D-serine deaminase-like pyridoxal phosphate-dependent protein
MSLSYEQLRSALDGQRMPCAFVDLDALDRNLERVTTLLRDRGTWLRIASKSVRVVSILERLRERGGALLRGVMCFAVEEAAFLAEHGFDDLLVAYPVFQRSDIELAVSLTKRGVDIKLMADCRETIDRIAAVAREHDTAIATLLCVDMSLELAAGRLHLGVRRSPLHEPADVVALARYLHAQQGARFAGLMGYEAQVAGLGDDSPFAPALNPVKRMLKHFSAPELASRRVAMVDALRAAQLPPALVNGGGSGSLDTTTAETGVTEVTAGSAFFKPHLFDYFSNPHMRALEPACFFALEVTREPAPNMLTCLGGGYVASGSAGADKLPLPWLPRGLELLSEEGAGEVQTPLRGRGIGALSIGDPVVFRHAKAGELAERFNHYLLLEGGVVVDRVPTYRGEGQCFF